MSTVTVRLRPVTEADLPNYVRWLNDPEVTQWLLRDPGLTLEQEREWFAHVSSPEFTDVIQAIEAEGRHIGGCGLHIREDGLSANFGIHIGEKPLWGQGYGAAATREMLRIGFVERGLHRIQLETWVHNARATRCYEKCGFRHEGVRRQAYFKAGRWIDAVMMAILREDWDEIVQPLAGGVDIRIRPFTLADYDEVARLWQTAGLGPRPSDTRDEVAKKLRRDPDLFLVACLGARIVGTAIGGWDGRRGWVYRMAVHPAYQRRGIGRTLMEELETRFRAKGALAINLIYNSDSAQARAFYHSLGYEPRAGISVMGKGCGEGSRRDDRNEATD